MSAHPTTGPDRTTQRVLRRLQSLVPVAYALAAAVGDRAEDTTAPHRRPTPAGSSPANLHVLDVQAELDQTLGELLRRARHALGLADQILKVSEQTGARCPHCRQLSLLANVTRGWVRCTNTVCRATPDDHEPPSWDLEDGLAAGMFSPPDLEELPFNVEDGRYHEETGT